MDRSRERTEATPAILSRPRARAPSGLPMAGLACLLVCWPAASSASAQEAPALDARPYEFETRSGEVVDAELGTFEVPENRADPASRRITLSFVRFRSTAERPGPPIVYLAGGPGGSGVAAATGDRFRLQTIESGSLAVPFDFAIPDGDGEG